MTKPSLPLWDTADAGSTEPPTAKKSAGAKPGFPEAAQYFNWLVNRVWKWLRGLQGSYADITVGTSGQVTAFQATHTVDDFVAAAVAGDVVEFLDGSHALRNELIGAADVTLRGESSEAILSFGTNALDQVWGVDDTPAATEYVDKTAVANSATSADFAPFDFTAAEAIGDWVAFGSARPFRKLVFDNAGGTAGTVGVGVWEYWNGAWVALTGVVDGTAGFTAAVADGQEVAWTLPADWAASVINASASLFYVRFRITTVYTVNPVYDQGFIRSMLALTGARARIKDGLRLSVAGAGDLILSGADSIAEISGAVYSVYAASGGAVGYIANDLQGKEQKGAASGYASLDGSSKVVQEPASKAQASGIASLDASSVVVEPAPSVRETGAGAGDLKVKVIEIGDWNMDLTTTANIAHGVTQANIRSVSVLIRDDAGTTMHHMPFLAPNTSGGADGFRINGANIDIQRSTTASGFDDPTYDSTSFNRGFITVWYVG